MPTNKDFKRLVRARMRKTGEAYTAARRHLIDKKPQAKPATPPAPDYATRAGMSDATIKAKTGCTWERWVNALDQHEAHTWPHGKIARFVHDKYKMTDWWAQTVTVGYERIKGLRARGQRRDGSYEATKSRVLPVPLGTLYRAFSDARLRARWLVGVEPSVRTPGKNRSVRMTWPDGSKVAVGFFAKGAAKSQVAVQHEKLPDRATATRVKEFWTARLAALAEILAT